METAAQAVKETVIGNRPVCAVVTEWPLKVGWEREFLEGRLLKAGFTPGELIWLSVLEQRPPGGLIRKSPQGQLTAASEFLTESLRVLAPRVTLALGDYVCELLTGEPGIDKWQASVLQAHGMTVIPCYPMERVSKDLTLQVWLSLCAKKAHHHSHNEVKEQAYDFLLNPPLEVALDYLRGPVRLAELISVDIETGRGQINTVGFAISGTRAIAINVLPDRLGATSFRELWQVITGILESEQPKVLQNFIYEQMYFSRYGIRLTGVTHDTMIAQKFLWPEFEMGLDAVGRMYTDMPYWKEDGKSWNDIRDWQAHYAYNCRDTVGTFQGMLGQRKDLTSRDLLELHDSYLTKLFPAVAEMCSRGFPVSAERYAALRAEVFAHYEGELTELRKHPGAEKLNPKSNQQVKAFLSGGERGYDIPKKYDAKTKSYKPSTDEKALKKLRGKYPDDPALTHLLKLAKAGKALSSYLSFKPDADGRMRYQIIASATETCRMAGYCDPWDNGFNPQTTPGGNKGINVKRVFECAPGKLFLQADLKQAESRFVAYDSADLNLIQALEDPGRDIHWEVACEILRTLGKDVPEKKDKFWRQLGKKSGHGANYSMKEATFIESCIGEMDVVFSRKEAHAILESYHALFPGIRMWHHRLRQELGIKRMLTTPLGHQRYFFGRLDDNMFREGYAYRPQTTIPAITNQLMLFLLSRRAEGAYDFGLLLQNHDSLLLEVSACGSDLSLIAKDCLNTKLWHPKVELAGGHLIIPTDIEVAQNYGELTTWHE